MYDSESDFNPHDENVSCVLVIWELRRPHRFNGCAVETNKLLAYLYASNTNVQVLGGEGVLVAVAKYVVGYCQPYLPSQTGMCFPAKMGHLDCDTRYWTQSLSSRT